MRSIAPKRSKKKLFIVVALCVLALFGIGVGAVYAIDQRNKQIAADKYGSDSTNPSDNTPNSDDNDSTGSTSSPKDDTGSAGTNGESTPAAEGVQPSAPTGTFVSNHNPNLDGSPHPNVISSTCTTSPGVSCYIEFKKNAIAKTLAKQTTDANGNTVWNWKLSDIGLSEGTWTVTAYAVNNNLTSQSEDPIKLEIEP